MWTLVYSNIGIFLTVAPLIAAQAFASGLSFVSSALGIFSFVGDVTDDSNDIINGKLDEIQSQPTSLKSAVDNISDKIDGAVQANIGHPMGLSKSALDPLSRYQSSDDPIERAAITQSAIQDAENSLNAIVLQTKAIMSTATLDTLGYAFTAIHYAVVARQAVAAVTQDRPLGSAGLHKLMKETATFL